MGNVVGRIVSALKFDSYVMSGVAAAVVFQPNPFDLFFPDIQPGILEPVLEATKSCQL